MKLNLRHLMKRTRSGHLGTEVCLLRAARPRPNDAPAEHLRCARPVQRIRSVPGGARRWIGNQQSRGSGVIIDPEGCIVNNALVGTF